jgi:hypothetical protein
MPVTSNLGFRQEVARRLTSRNRTLAAGKDRPRPAGARYEVASCTRLLHGSILAGLGCRRAAQHSAKIALAAELQWPFLPQIPLAKPVAHWRPDIQCVAQGLSHVASWATESETQQELENPCQAWRPGRASIIQAAFRGSAIRDGAPVSGLAFACGIRSPRPYPCGSSGQRGPRWPTLTTDHVTATALCGPSVWQPFGSPQQWHASVPSPRRAV